MNNKYIATRLHKARELAPNEAFFKRCEQLPHYVIDQSLVEIMARSDVQASIAAMIEAEIAHLPFEEMMIELQSSENIHHYVILSEDGGAFAAQCAATLGTEAAEVAPAPYRLELGDAEIRVHTSTRAHEGWMHTSAMALATALLMLNVQGVDKEVIEPTKLNKQRLLGGKPKVHRHTLVRIAHVYDRNGARHGEGKGRTLPVHMRAGHVRHQAHGEGLTLRKIVYIPPVLVNFHPGAVVSAPRRVIAA